MLDYVMKIWFWHSFQNFILPTLCSNEVWERVDGVYKTIVTPSPDLFVLSPVVGNCLAMNTVGPPKVKGSAPSTAVRVGSLYRHVIPSINLY